MASQQIGASTLAWGLFMLDKLRITQQYAVCEARRAPEVPAMMVQGTGLRQS